MTENVDNRPHSSQQAEWHSGKPGISRRNFLKILGVGATAAALSGIPQEVASAAEKLTNNLQNPYASLVVPEQPTHVEQQQLKETTQIFPAILTTEDAIKAFSTSPTVEPTPSLTPTSTKDANGTHNLPTIVGEKFTALMNGGKDSFKYQTADGTKVSLGVKNVTEFLDRAQEIKIIPIPLGDGNYSVMIDAVKGVDFSKEGAQNFPPRTLFIFNPDTATVSYVIPGDYGQPAVMALHKAKQGEQPTPYDVLAPYAKSNNLDLVEGSPAMVTVLPDGTIGRLITNTEAINVKDLKLKVPEKDLVYRAEASAKLTNEAFMASYKFQSGDKVTLTHKGNIPNSNKDWVWSATTNGQTYDNLPVFEIKAFNEVQPLESMRPVQNEQIHANNFNGAGLYLGSEIRTRMIANKETDMLEVIVGLPSQDGKETLIVRFDAPADVNVGFSDDGGGNNVTIPGREAFQRMATMKAGSQINFQAFEKVQAAAILKVFNTNEQGCDQNAYCRYLLASLTSNQFTNIADIAAWQKASPAQRTEIEKKFTVDPDGAVIAASDAFVTLASITWQPS